MTPEEKAARLAELDAADEAYKQARLKELDTADKADVFTRGRRVGELDYADSMAKPWYGRVADVPGVLADTLSGVVHGASFGLDDKAAAGLHTLAGNIGSTLGISEDVDYSGPGGALEQEQFNTARRQGRQNANTPGSAQALEGISSFIAPGGFIKAGLGKAGNAIKGAVPYVGSAASKLVNNPVTRFAGDILENAGYGAVSAFGRDQDVKEGATVGATGPAAPLVSATAAATIPAAMKGLGVGGGAELGNQLFGPTGAYFGGKYGGAALGALGTAGANAINSPAGRGALSLLMRAPGRLYGQVGEEMDLRR